jgi:putative colanic acid biosynthesis acetyltransferase WcaF
MNNPSEQPAFKHQKAQLLNDDARLRASISRSWEGGASFSLLNRIYRLSWQATWLLLAAWTPPPFRAWRRWLLKLFGADLAPTATVYASARIWSPANLRMDAYASIGPRARIYSMSKITIGSYTVISQDAHLCAGTHDIEDPNFQLQARPITLGRRAWIAADAFVGPGVTVGDGAVLGARACAMRDLEPWMVYRGNPATALRPRHIRFGEPDSATTTDTSVVMSSSRD